MLLKALLTYSFPCLVLTQFLFGIEFICYSPSLFTVAPVYIFILYVYMKESLVFIGMLA